MPTPAGYRVRLFLSVDLSGSTAFKDSKGAQPRDGEPTPKWVTVFHHFYSDFPARFKSHYANGSANIEPDTCPVVWKAVGDELVFCGRVRCKKSVSHALLSFINTIIDYRKHLLDETPELDVKGAAWLAAFPEPDRAVRVRVDKGKDWISASEELEAAADASPYDFDFLGKAIDTGFRVAHLASPERFALSVQLTRLISQFPDGFGFDFPILFDTPVLLKGVNKGIPYPFLFIDTMEHLPSKSVTLRERELLEVPGAPGKDKILAYLNEYCTLVGTDEICLAERPPNLDIDPPASYQKLLPQIQEHFKQEAARGVESIAEPPDVNDSDADRVEISDDLTPLS